MLTRLFLITCAIAIGVVACRRESVPASGTVARDSVAMNDAYGVRVTVPTPVSRIVSLAPNITEILFALGAERQLVGVTRYCTYPEAAQSITKVGDLQTPNYELLVALKPEIVFMSYSGNLPQVYEKLRGMGMHPFLAASRTIEDVELSIRTIGHMIGRDSLGAAVSDRICGAVDTIRAATARRKSVDAVLLVDVVPPIAVGNGFLDEALTIAGGRNVVHNDAVDYPNVSREAIVNGAPRVIIVPKEIAESTEEIWNMFPEWQSLRAAGTKIVRLDADALMRPGPRLATGIQSLSRAIDEAR